MITLTETASSKVAELIAQEGQGDLMLRVAVRPGGCSGFSCFQIASPAGLVIDAPFLALLSQIPGGGADASGDL